MQPRQIAEPGLTDLRLLIIANDPLARTGLSALLGQRPDCTVVGQAAGDTDLQAEVDAYRPDVALWDLGWDPAYILEQLVDFRDIDLPSVVLLPNSSYVEEVWATGALGLLLRDSDADKIVAASLGATQGLVTIEPTLIKLLLPNPEAVPSPLVETLTPRELEVLQLLAEGLPNKNIARQLDISEHTVKFHVNAIMNKLDSQSRTEAVVRATQLGLILL